YRLRGDEGDGGLSGDEVDDIDLDSDLDQSVTVVEWGAGVAEQLSDDRLEIEIRRSDDPADDARQVVLRPVGTRWAAVDLATLRTITDLPTNGDTR
ncbi:MAG: hypothetical protein Q4G46_11635, partial [Propionibacteriaceae bacterium]|nr:hypothetical protein [Propionibacteriaceae bacterium]